MINKAKKLKGVLSDIDLDCIGYKNYGKTRAMELEDHNKRKNEHNQRMEYMDMLEVIQNCTVLNSWVLGYDMDHIKNLKMKHLRALL